MKTDQKFHAVIESDGCLYWLDVVGLMGLERLYDRFPTSMEPLLVELA